LEGLLPSGGYSQGQARAGPMGAPPDACHPAQTMAAWYDRVPRASGKGCKAGCCVTGGRQYAPPLAEQRHTSERSPRSKLGRSTRHPPSLLTSTPRTAGCGPACPVVWQGRAGDCFPYADCENAGYARTSSRATGYRPRGGTAPRSPSRRYLTRAASGLQLPASDPQIGLARRLLESGQSSSKP
jgi:hypothetical protein